MTLRLTDKQWRAVVNGPRYLGNEVEAKKDLEFRGYTVVVYNTKVKKVA